MRGLGVDPLQDRLTRPLDGCGILGMQFEDAKLALNKEDAGLDLGHGFQCEVDDALDG